MQCQGCKRTFNSRNALFKHIRGDEEASMNCPIALQAKPMVEEEFLMTTVIRYGYYRERDGTPTSIHTTNEVVANMIHEAFSHHVNCFLGDENALNANENQKFGGRSQFREGAIFSTTALSYSSAAIMRQPALRQDEEVVAAASEVLSFNYRLRHKPTTIARWKEYANSGKMQKHLQNWLENESSLIQIQLHHLDALVPRSSKFYAERSATQRSYTFLLPVTWILNEADDGRRSDAIVEVINWGNNLSRRSKSHCRHDSRADGQKKMYSPECILQLKKSLKATESETVPNRRVRRRDERDRYDDDSVDGDTDDEVFSTDTPARLSHGRFGQLWRKEKKCWSNFSSLTGMASSPGYEAVWRTMDRAKIVGVVDLQYDNNASDERDNESMEDALERLHIILEFKADGFVVGEIPRIISAVVAMTNRWLPQNFFDIATRPEVYMPTPPPPPSLHRLYYFQSARYHFHELTSNAAGESGSSGKSFARTIQAAGSQSEHNWEEQLREKLRLGGGASSVINRRTMKEWLSELRDVVSPDLRRHVESFQAEHLIEQSQEADSVQDLPLIETDAPMGAFSVTLDLLREVAENRLWPKTSEARSRVIKSPAGLLANILATKKKAIASSFPGDSISSGSFTVINEGIWQSDELPLGNALFPELRKAVFKLEEEIIHQSSSLPAAEGMTSSSLRRSSTHCAVNRNAQFTPHVDSGRGQGQSVSLIVGLGNYTGGEILVEGKPYDIRYNALEFDGWNQLHWTSPFKGERYSLVFFTPELSKKDERQGVDMLNTADDLHASRLAQEHSKTVPFLPPLYFRPKSTDALVINELLDPAKGSAYALKQNAAPTMPSGFSLANHDCVLDIGAHIGVFSRMALLSGCKKVIAYEPETTNFELLSRNLNVVQPLPSTLSSQPVIELHSAAVVHGSSESRTLVRARNENSGKQNTWRHSLEEYSQYVDRTTDLPSALQKKTLDRFPVDCVSFFYNGERKQRGALVSGVTFVKMDCEGAEIDILLSEDASQRSSWLDCSHLVVEWSFTKERRVDIFHKAMANLKDSGFEVYYEGMGSWWDTDAGTLWPYPNDALVFAAMKPNNM